MIRNNFLTCLFLALTLSTTPAFSETTNKPPVKKKTTHSVKRRPKKKKVVHPVKKKPTQKKISAVTSAPLPGTNSQALAPMERIVIPPPVEPQVINTPPQASLEEPKHNNLTQDTTECLSYEQSGQLACSIAAYIAKQVPQGTTISVPSKVAREYSSLTIALNDSLKKAGLDLISSKNKMPNAPILRYQVSRFNEGFWVQLQLNHTEANRFYSLDKTNNLMATAPFSIREAQ